VRRRSRPADTRGKSEVDEDHERISLIGPAGYWRRHVCNRDKRSLAIATFRNLSDKGTDPPGPVPDSLPPPGGDTIRRVCASGHDLFAALRQVEGKFANGFQHHETRLGLGLIHPLSKTFVYQRGQPSNRSMDRSWEGLDDGARAAMRTSSRLCFEKHFDLDTSSFRFLQLVQNLAQHGRHADHGSLFEFWRNPVCARIIGGLWPVSGRLVSSSAQWCCSCCIREPSQRSLPGLPS
jgi:hypothetical protein